eukprot:m.47648 g.47648  ORF g.47648 m.47648 type:complete len:241 (-) comp10521_c0_seq2:63-785(-)
METNSEVDVSSLTSSGPGVIPQLAFATETGAKVVISKGSVVAFHGDAIVNAANEGCIGGGGVDGAINTAGGKELMKARKALPIIEEKYEIRCKTGDAVVTSGKFGKLECKHVIHAVGPRFSYHGQSEGAKSRFSPFSSNEDKPRTKERRIEESHEENDKLLMSAFSQSIARAKELDVKTMGFSLISSSIFAGSRGKVEIAKMSLRAVKEAAYSDLQVHLVAFTDAELDNLKRAAQEVFKK